MKKETINKFIADYQGSDLAGALSLFITQVDAVKRNLRTYYNACDIERQRHESEKAKLDTMMLAIQAQCPHPETETCYGPYENYTNCVHCQKELNR
jgi:hypothetical protein